MSNFTLINLPTFSGHLGNLTVLEKVLPFEVNRVYWIYGADGRCRGGHRHAVTRQALIAIAGSVEIYLCDGASSKSIMLDRPEKCLIVEPEDWHKMTFGANSILLVMASHCYDKDDYIDDQY